LGAQLDRKVTLEAMQITRRIMTAPAMRGIATDEIAPGVMNAFLRKWPPNGLSEPLLLS
jgi:hypothetical protein